MNRWIIAICPVCGQVTDITKLLLGSSLGTAFVKDRLMEWVSTGLTIEIRNDSHFPVSVNPCGGCIREPQSDKVEASILSLLDEAGAMNTGLLDGIVHDVAISIGSDVNNEGTSAQVRFITKQSGDSGVISIVTEVMDLLAEKREVEEE